MRPVTVLLTVGLGMALPTVCLAATWEVPGDSGTIQGGIDLASPGDTVLVHPGTYTGMGNKDLDFGGDDIVLLGEAGSEVTIIDCEGSGRGLYFHSGESPSAVVDGFSIRNGNTLTPDGFGRGGGVCCVSFSSPTVINCRFLENWAGYGAGMYCRNCSSEILNCTFLENVAACEGGGIASVFSCIRLIGCAFLDNDADTGGAVDHNDSTGPHTVIDCVFWQNRALWGGGGAASFHSSHGGSIFHNCVFFANSANTEGGAIHWGSGDWASHSVTNCTFVENSASDGGAIRSEHQSPSVLVRTILSFCTEGEAITWDGTTSSSVLSCCDIYGNAGGPGSAENQIGSNGNISEDPLFCGQVNYPSDPYRLDIASPCARGNPPCLGELIGARGTGCSGSVATEHTTWGRVKVLYR